MQLVQRSLLHAAAGVMVLALAAPGTAHAHEEGVLKPSTRQFVAGDSVQIGGQNFSKTSTLELFLVGVGGRFTLPRVKTDADGGFSAYVIIPPEVTPGAYRLVAVAADGDEVAGLDVSVAAAQPLPDAGSHAEHEMSEEPSDEPLALERARGAAVTGGSLALVLVSFGFGLGLLRRPHHE